ncbi:MULTISPECIES: hypothetical protein [Roseateles]|uniref:Uncharacterized protein n=1 Tax=Pelomonas aquatica TaxID=431058 RepID=A0ABU1Z9X5_9BURK|nr:MULTISPECIES: hypothetical protein [Roseateles]KQY87142.1 hypothetical protein ASD35_18005 [Pelomonas sp. Root1444]MDR7297407.1 hypothetical protein [Pelomonas aquatica]
MKPLLPALLLSLTATLPLSAQAGPKAEALGICLGDSTTGKDRKDLARWIFVAMSAHPEIKPLSNVPDATRAEADEGVAQLLTALLTERCRVQAREAAQQEGSAGFVTAFQKLGELAMKELMTNPEVGAAMGGFERRIDRAKVEAALGGR